MAKFSHLVAEEARSYDDTEWSGKIGGEDITLFAKPLTGSDFEYAAKRTKNPGFANSPTLDGMVELIIRKAKADDGNRAFDLGDKTVMMAWNVELTGEIFRGLFGDALVAETDEDFEDRIKN